MAGEDAAVATPPPETRLPVPPTSAPSATLPPVPLASAAAHRHGPTRADPPAAGATSGDADADGGSGGDGGTSGDGDGTGGGAGGGAAHHTTIGSGGADGDAITGTGDAISLVRVPESLARVLAYMRRIEPSAESLAASAPLTPEIREHLGAAPALLPTIIFQELVFGRDLGSGSFSTVRYCKHVQRGRPALSWPE